MDPMDALVKYEMLLQLAHGPLPNVAELVSGEPIRGNWWSHSASHAIFDALNALARAGGAGCSKWATLTNGDFVGRRSFPFGCAVEAA